MADEVDLKVLNLLHIGDDVPVENLIMVCEGNDYKGRIGSDGFPSELGKEIACLSYRWDIVKPKDRKDALEIRSEKHREFINRARAQGFKFCWVDWMCVPQYPADGEPILAHVKASSSIYQRCSVIIVDKEEVAPGIRACSPSYMERLWCSAEQASMLANPTVSRKNFIECDMICMESMMTVLALANNIQFLALYKMTFDTSNGEYELFTPNPMMTLMSKGLVLEEKLHTGTAGVVTAVLGALYTAGMEKFEECGNKPFPQDGWKKRYSAKDEAQILQNFRETGKNSVLESLMSAIEPKNGRIKPDTFAKLSQTFSNFDLYEKYYEAILCLMYVIFEDFLDGKWNRDVFKTVSQTLENYNEYGSLGANDLQCTYTEDIEVVKQMILAIHGSDTFWVSIDGIELPEVPIGAVFSDSIQMEASIEELLIEEKIQFNANTVMVNFNIWRNTDGHLTMSVIACRDNGDLITMMDSSLFITTGTVDYGGQTLRDINFIPVDQACLQISLTDVPTEGNVASASKNFRVLTRIENISSRIMRKITEELAEFLKTCPPLDEDTGNGVLNLIIEDSFDDDQEITISAT